MQPRSVDGNLFQFLVRRSQAFSRGEKVDGSEDLTDFREAGDVLSVDITGALQCLKRLALSGGFGDPHRDQTKRRRRRVEHAAGMSQNPGTIGFR